MSPKPAAILSTRPGPDQLRLTFYTPDNAEAPTAHLRELPITDQPIPRLTYYGAGALSVIELLTIICSFPDLQTANNLLARYGKLADLARVPFSELQTTKGIGAATAARLKAAIELGYRLHRAEPADRPTIKSPADAAMTLIGEMGTLEQEELRTLILNTKNVLLAIQVVSKGSLNTAQLRVCEVFRDAIRLNAAAILVAHNHPSGDPTPSADDVSITRLISEAGKLLNIDVLDHLVIAQSRWVSLKERGLGF